MNTNKPRSNLRRGNFRSRSRLIRGGGKNTQGEIQTFKKQQVFLNSIQLQNRVPTIYINRFSNGLPDEMYINLTYTAQFSVDLAINQGAIFYEGMNPYDPDIHLGGESSRDYAVLQPIYRYCRCYGSSATLKYTIYAGQPFTAVLSPTLNNFGMAFTLVSSLPRAVTGHAVSLGGISSRSINNSCSSASVFGIPDMDYDLDHNYDLDNREASGSPIEPPNRWFWICYFSTLAGQNGIKASGDIKIVYRCKFFTRKQLATLQEITDSDPTTFVDMLPPQKITELNDASLEGALLMDEEV